MRPGRGRRARMPLPADDAARSRRPAARQRGCAVSARLAGKRVMIVEDEEILGAVLEDALQLSGAAAPTLCSDPDSALSALAQQGFDAAILDIALGTHDSYAIADELRRRRIPFAFATAFERLPEPYRDVPFLRKPYNYNDLVRCVAALCGVGAADGGYGHRRR